MAGAFLTTRSSIAGGNVDSVEDRESSVRKCEGQTRSAESDARTCEILAAEIAQLKDQLTTEKDRCSALEASGTKWYAALRNVRKQLSRREKKGECSAQKQEEDALAVASLETTLKEMSASLRQNQK